MSLIPTLALVLSFASEAGNVWKEVNEWTKNDPIPAELKVVPKCVGDDCGMRPDLARHSIEKTENFLLLREIVIGSEATSLIFHVALNRLLEADGFFEVRELLLSTPINRKEHRSLRAKIGQPVAEIHVVAILTSEIPIGESEEILQRLGGLLKEGASWDDAFQLVDVETSKRRNGAGSVLLYKYSGWLTPQRVDFSWEYEVGVIPRGHVGTIFETGPGSFIREGYDGLYLYHVKEIYGPEI